MSSQYLSELRIMSFNFAPKGWAACNGQLLPINQNQALFSLLGTTYGGDGQTTFALPNLETRVPIHMGNGFALGERGGEQTHTLTINEQPAHIHVAQGSSVTADISISASNFLGAQSGAYGPPSNLTGLHPSTITNAGGSQPHDNLQPYLVLNFCIALVGIFPSRN